MPDSVCIAMDFLLLDPSLTRVTRLLESVYLDSSGLKHFYVTSEAALHCHHGNLIYPVRPVSLTKSPETLSLVPPTKSVVVQAA